MSSPADQEARLKFETQFRKLSNAIHSASSPSAIMVGLKKKILGVFGVQMATIFLVDSVRKQMVSWILLPGDYLQKFD